MKKIYNKTCMYVITTAMLMAGCTPQTFDMGISDLTPDDLIEGIAYTITPDSKNPNIIYLESKLGPEFTSLWEHPMGRSQDSKVTLNMAFNGTYNVKFGVMTRAGAIYGEYTTFKINDFCADFVTGEMWDMLTNGAGNSKSWVPDNGSFNMKQGFYSCFAPEATYLDMVSDEGKNNWYPNGHVWWEPSNNDIGHTKVDLDTYMTFSLEGKAALKIHKVENGQETVTEGLFNMNTESHMISAIDVDFHHGAWADGKAVDFRTDFQILLLTENQLMIGNFRDAALSGEGKCVFCWNFVSKEYADNYVPEITEDPTPELPDNWYDEVSQIVTNKIVWTLSADSPFDWFELNGKRKNEFSKPEDYPSIFKPVSDLKNISLTMRSTTNDFVFKMPGFDDVEGKYSISADGIYDFSEVLPSMIIGGSSVEFKTDNNKLRVLNIEKDATGVTGMWLGVPVYNNQGKVYQYLGYHFTIEADVAKEIIYTGNLNYFNTSWTTYNSDDVLITKEGKYKFTLNLTDSTPYGIYLDVFEILKDHPNTDIIINAVTVDGNSVDFDDTLIDRGEGDLPTTYRRYILNPWAQVPAFPDANVFVTENSITIEVSVIYNDDLVTE